MRILAIDTSGPVCSASTAVDGTITAEVRLNNGKTHSTHLLPLMENALEMTGLTYRDLDWFAVTKGPGSFTGIRIGIATIQGIAFAAGLKVLPVSSLAVMAEPYRTLGLPVLPLIDARHDRAFTGLWAGDSLLLPEQLTPLAELPGQILSLPVSSRPQEILLTGDGMEAAGQLDSFTDPLQQAGIRLLYGGLGSPLAGHAASLAMRLYQELGEAALTDPAELKPAYLTATSAERNLGIEV